MEKKLVQSNVLSVFAPVTLNTSLSVSFILYLKCFQTAMYIWIMWKILQMNEKNNVEISALVPAMESENEVKEKEKI